MTTSIMPGRSFDEVRLLPMNKTRMGAGYARTLPASAATSAAPIARFRRAEALRHILSGAAVLFKGSGAGL